jgi:hypothetical protein
MIISLNIDVVAGKYQGDMGGSNYENHEHEEKAVAACPSIFINPSIQQPEMIGRLRLSSIDPRSKKSYLVSKKPKVVLNNAPRASATPLITPATIAMTNNPKGPPAPIATIAPFL